MQVLATGLCGSDVEKLGVAPAGTVLGHEVVARRTDGARVALVHHRPCGDVRALLDRARVDLQPLRRPDDRARRPRGGGRRRPRASSCRTRSTTRPAPTSSRSLASFAASSAFRAGPFSWSDRASSGGCSRRCCAGGATRSSRATSAPSATGKRPTARSTPLVLCAPAAPLDARRARRHRARLRDAGSIDLDDVYRRELTLVGSRSATPATCARPPRCSRSSSFPDPTVLPLARFAEGLELYRDGRALKVVFTP